MDAQVLKHQWPRYFNEAHTIGFNVAGNGGFFFRGSMQVAVPGSLDLLNPQDVHTGQALGGQTWLFQSILLSPEFVDDLGMQIGEQRRPLHFKQPLVRDETLSGALAHLFESLAHRSERPAMTPREYQSAGLSSENAWTIPGQNRVAR
jgi:hypothetical protein